MTDLGSAESLAYGEAIKVAEVDDVEPGETKLLSAGLLGTSDDVALLRDDDGTYYALDDTCSHEDASLADGWVEDGEVECPLHAARFDLLTGAALCLPATSAVGTHPVEIRGSEVWLRPRLG